MRSDKWTIAMGIVGALALAGCGKPRSETLPAVNEPAGPAAIDALQPSAPAEAAPLEVFTNDAPTAGGKFTTTALASPFAEANMALRESYNRALIACQIGDYANAVTELDDLSATPDLTPAQRQAIKDLLAQALKMAPELASRAATAADAGQPQTPPQFPLVAPDTAASPNDVQGNPFSTADAATWRSFTRAKAAFKVGDYDTALTVLKDLASDPRLNYQQKYAVQSMLDKIPQAVPARSSGPLKN